MKKQNLKKMAKAITLGLVLGTALTAAQPVWAEKTEIMSAAESGTGTGIYFDGGKVSWGDGATASGYIATAWGNGTTASGMYSTAWGFQTTASKNGATAWGYQTTASHDYATAWGYKTTASGKYATAFGNGSKAGGQNSLAALGGVTGQWNGSTYEGSDATNKGTNAVAIGQGAIAKADNSVALGQYAVTGIATKATGGENDIINEFAVGGGTNGGKTYYSQITGVANGVNAHDAVNYGQVKDGMKGLQFDSGTNKLSYTTLGSTAVQYVDLSSLAGGGDEVVGKDGEISVTDGTDENAGKKVIGLAGAVKDNITALQTTVGDSNGGLVKKVAELETGKADRATTLSGYGITDAYTKSEVNTELDKKADKATTLAGYGITDAYTKTETDSKITGAISTATAGASISEVKLDGTKVTITEGTGDGANTKTVDLAGLNTIQSQANADAIAAINNTETGILKQAKDYTDALENGQVKTNTNTIGAYSSVKDTQGITYATTGTIAGDVIKFDQTLVEHTQNIADIYSKIGGGTSGASNVYIGNGAVANNTSVAIGSGAIATGTNSISIGIGNKVTGANSGAFGDPSEVSGSGSYVFGNNNYVSGNNTFVLGNSVGSKEAPLAVNNSVILGNGSTATEDNVVSVGSETQQRKIVNVADGEDVHDAATVGQVLGHVGDLQSEINTLNGQIDRMGTRINKVGAGAAALAALHPLDFDPENKLAFSAGVGNYRGEKAAAVGMFYRPTDRVMFSMAGTVGNDNNMVNAGVTFALDRKIKLSNGLESPQLGKASRETLVNEVQLLAAENTKLSDRVSAQDKRMAEQDEKIAKLLKMIEEMKNK